MKKIGTIHIGARLDDVGRTLAARLEPGRALVVSPTPVARRWASPLLAGLRRSGFDPSMALIADGERHKTLSTVEKLYGRALAARLDRRSVVIALGGGVAGDMAGFVAATYMRGVPFVQCPTTLLAMVDASIGGKTGVDLPEGKNLVGAFWQPALVCMDLRVLKTLPDRHWRTGMAEVIKYGLMADPRLWARLEKSDLPTLKKNPRFLEQVVAVSAGIKADVVARDERETTGLRATLNLGHTFAHAIETVSGYTRYTHGEAVAIGLCAAARLGARMGLFPPADIKRVDELVRRWGLPVRVNRPLSRAGILAAMGRDKKALKGGFRFVVPTGIGRAKVVGGVAANDLAGVLDEVGL
ncbi:MAG: 3-dehydroquinate synthase [Elusimicrobia bacterium]|nr:3-dehydroquinate synthase [Elusimicrobiota bacterium]